MPLLERTLRVDAADVGRARAPPLMPMPRADAKPYTSLSLSTSLSYVCPLRDARVDPTLALDELLGACLGAEAPDVPVKVDDAAVGAPSRWP